MRIKYNVPQNNYIQYYGDEARLYFNTYEYAQLNDLQLQVLMCCNGKNEFEDISRNIFEKYRIPNSDDNRTLLYQVVKKLIDSNVIAKGNNIESSEIKIYGEKKKQFPTAFILEMTSRCNFRCPHCYKEAEYQGTDIDLNLIEQVVSSFSGKVRTVTISGGEPLLHPNANQIICGLVKDFNAYLITNGFFLDKIGKDIVDRLDGLQISIYGYNERTYREFTKKENVFERIKQNLRAYDYNERMMGSIIISTLNKNLLHEYVKACIDMGLKRVRFGVIFPTGRANGNEDITLKRNEYLKIYEQINELREQYAQQISIYPFSDISNYQHLTSGTFGCQAGKNTITISQNGYVRPCNLLTSQIFSGYTFEEYYKDIINNEVTVDENKYIQYIGYSCTMKSLFRKNGNQMSGTGNHPLLSASLLAHVFV